MRDCGRRAVVAFMALALALALSVAGCAGSQDDAGPDAAVPPAPAGLVGSLDPELHQMFPARVRSSGVLRLAADPSYPPSTFRDPARTIVGTLPDLATAITSRAGLKIEWVEVPFDGMLGGLQAKRFDASWSGWSISAEREQLLNLVAYIEAGTSVLVRSGNPASVRTALDLCGRRVAAQTGTTQAQQVADELQRGCATAGRPAVELLQLPQQTNVNQAVATGRADALLADNSLVGYQARLQPGVFEAVPGILLQAVPAAVAVPKDDAQLAQALAAGFNKIIADGTYAKVLARWGIPAAAVAKAEVNPVIR